MEKKGNKKPCMQLGGDCECLNPTMACARMSANRLRELGDVNITDSTSQSDSLAVTEPKV